MNEFNPFGGMIAALTEAATSEEVIRDEAAARVRDGSKSANSEGVARSWVDPEIRAARIAKESVRVTDYNGGQRDFPSVRAAFRECRLPDRKHIRFRLKLKALPRGEKLEFVDKNGPLSASTSCRKFLFELVPFNSFLAEGVGMSDKAVKGKKYRADVAAAARASAVDVPVENV